VVNDDILEANKAHKTEIADLKAEKAKARAERNLKFAEMLCAEREKHEKKLLQLAENQKLLAQPVSTESSGRFGRRVSGAGAVLVTVLSGGALAPAAALLYGVTVAAAQIDKASATTSSALMGVVRGRSPGHYEDGRRGSLASGMGFDGGASPGDGRDGNMLPHPRSRPGGINRYSSVLE
jgi:hypothetical protein